jgi:hypothetical protein
MSQSREALLRWAEPMPAPPVILPVGLRTQKRRVGATNARTAQVLPIVDEISQ